MQTIKLYKYNREDGGVSISPVKPSVEYIELVRLIADEGKELTNGEVIATCIDALSAEGWSEVSAFSEYMSDNEEVSGDEFMTMLEGVL